MDTDLKLLQSEIEVHLARIAELLPPSYRLSLICRCTSDLPDADILLTDDTLPEIVKAVDKRVKALDPQNNVPRHANKTIEMEKVIAELCNCLEPVYSGSPEGRAYLSKCRALLSENINVG